jgi:hypothetical protein
MRYSVHTLDGRFRYQRWFQYYIGFSDSMGISLGPEHYNQCLQWFMHTYGWSAEVREYEEIYNWYYQSVPFISARGITKLSPPGLPECCNPHWSWSNGISKLRIYVASESELAFFQLKFPNRS